MVARYAIHELLDRSHRVVRDQQVEDVGLDLVQTELVRHFEDPAVLAELGDLHCHALQEPAQIAPFLSRRCAVRAAAGAREEFFGGVLAIDNGGEGQMLCVLDRPRPDLAGRVGPPIQPLYRPRSEQGGVVVTPAGHRVGGKIDRAGATSRHEDLHCRRGLYSGGLVEIVCVMTGAARDRHEVAAPAEASETPKCGREH